MSQKMNQLKQPRNRDHDYLALLSRQFPNIASASSEIINLSAILNLPKGTEHFMASGSPSIM